MRPLVIAPTPREAAAIGHGAVASGADVARTVAGFQRMPACDALLIVGVCGGLDPSLSPGSVILGRDVVTLDGAGLSPDPRLFAAVRRALRARSARFVSSKLLTVEAPAASRAEKTALWNTHGAGGVDMETYRLATIAEQSDLPWLAIRVVLDPGSSRLPATLRDWRPDVSERAIVRRIARHPWEWPAAARLAWQMRVACHALRGALDVALPAIEALRIADDRARRIELLSSPAPIALDASAR